MLLFLGHQYKLELSNKALTTTTVQFSIVETFTLPREGFSWQQCPQHRGVFSAISPAISTVSLLFITQNAIKTVYPSSAKMDMKSASEIG